jgi:hypothetical protein
MDVQKARPRPSVGTILGVIALVFALTGAASALPGKKSVDKNDLAKNVVRSKNIKNGAVKDVDLANPPKAATYTCGSARIKALGACFDSSPRTADTWFHAAGDCQDEGGVLPTVSELGALAEVVDIGTNNTGTAHWSGLVDANEGDAGINKAVVVSEGFTLQGQDLNGPTRAYRCKFPFTELG